MAATKAAKNTRRKAATHVSQNVAKRDQAAILLAEDEMKPQSQRKRSDQSIAEEVGISRQSITRWKRDPEFQAMIQDAKGKVIADALRLPSAQKYQRIRNLHEIAEKIRDVISLRGERYSGEEAAEAATGLIVRRQKISASGDVVTEWEFDAAPIRELRELYKHIAQETGQWEETLNVNHAGSVHHDSRLDSLTIEQMEAIERIRGEQ